MYLEQEGVLRAVKQGGRGAVTLHITGEDGEVGSYVLSQKDFEQLDLPPVGEVVCSETVEQIRELAGKRDAVRRSLAILERGDTNRKTLMRKLLSRGVLRHHAELAVQEMERRGYLDEESGAYRAVVLCANRKGWGPRKIHAYLVSHGYAGALAAQAIERAREAGEVDFAASRREFILARREAGKTEEQILRALWQAGF
ncbi:MAG: RecX family transcriptional regulator [Clostridia bacterium]|nr:RecX family transcriptional regulator [Clostridia bacterium]